MFFEVAAIAGNDRNFVEKHFLGLLNDDKQLSAGIAAIKTLLMVLEKTNCRLYKTGNEQQLTDFL